MDFFSFVKPKNDLETTSGKQDNVPFIPEEMWMKCPKCNTLLLTTDMEENLNVCTTCNHHFRMNAKRRVELFADPETFEEHGTELKSSNILGFPGYDKKLEKAKDKGNESVTCGTCKIDGTETVLCVMNAEFMMGSMGTVTGEKITRAFEYATEHRLPIVVCTVSGGARMQEGIVSLMQMAKTSGAVARHNEAGQLYIAVMTDPTTGGVTASFASLGDIIIAEPKVLIGFAGRRVIEGTINQKLPDDFQSAEFMLENGFVDMIVERKRMRRVLSHILRMHNYTGEVAAK